jgi:hypothetical protein
MTPIPSPCTSRFAACDGLDVRLVAIWPGLRRVRMCSKCRNAAAAMGMSLVEMAA